jgi:tetratricopeptide (TPR) repeat protein
LLWGLGNSATAKGEFQTALALCRELLEIARRSVSSFGQFLAHTLYGSTYHFLGDLAGSRNHLLEASEHYHDDDLGELPFTPPIIRLVISGATDWHLGYPERALHCADEMVALARRLGDPMSLCMAYFNASQLYHLTRDWPRMLQATEESLQMSVASQFPLLAAAGKIHIAYSRAQMRHTNGTAEQMRDGLSELAAIKWYVTRPMFLGWLTEVYMLTGDITEAVLSLEQALAFDTEEVLFQPELLRLRGELRLRGGYGTEAPFEMAERDFRAAMDAARAMSAKSDELRATTCLARLLAQRGRRDEARARLAEIYNWFTGGFDTADLKDAKELLDELSGGLYVG